MSTPKRPKRPADFNQRAYQVFQEAVGEAKIASVVLTTDGSEPTPDAVHEAAAALGRRGGLKGGKSRAERLTAEERSEAAKKATRAR